MVCDENDEDCMMSRCDDCKGNFAQHIIPNIMNKKKVIKWYQWMHYKGRAEKKEFSGTVFHCMKQLQQKTPQYLCHVFIKRKQSNYFEDIKETVNDDTVVCQVDYAENFTLQNQDQIQSAHWSKKQVSIFTAYAWMGGSGGQGYSFGLVSNQKKHNKYTVITCLEILVQEIITMMPDVNEIIFFPMVPPANSSIVMLFNI
ncbi:unnamed protein product [Rotaria sp. Silwood1]|nr:unnamed protein product [Rotaria sp. Silwood1]CAF3868949.1 unnamed protein product [Rotaria sp. Silwood1]CAF3915103.1 unnamed protein product [Rotaria sp. Silwood1]CAF3937606.1 unnamed protein product [Rotaria sp. Silwood1]CAF4016978.1 unnamed protein product [Rotaria sp. Silwood1]